ncbi:GNAT family N-acetyltransferase [Endozoicomonadaceae bacterium StTr2]
MEIRLIPVTASNAIDAIKVRPAPPELQQLHYNAHWIGHAFAHEDIECYLIKVGSDSIGFVCFGQCYSDEYLLHREGEGIAELYQIVILPAQQNRGYGKQVLLLIAAQLQQQGYHSLRVAHHPDADRAGKFYHALRFVKIGANYDDDPWLELTIASGED